METIYRRLRPFVSTLAVLVTAIAPLSPLTALPTSAVAGVTVTAATGGSAISSATVGGTYTTLTGPVITESDTGQIGTGTIVLNAPAGFVFRTSSTVTATVTHAGSCGGSGHQLVRLNSTDHQTVTPTASSITVTVTQASAGATVNCQSIVTYAGIAVRPLSASPLASGNITVSGTSSISGVTGATNFGTLTEVAALDHITVTPSGAQSVVHGDTLSFSAQGYDVSSNPIAGLTYTWSVVAGTGTGSVNSSGVLTAGKVGTVTVKATSGSVSGNSGTVTITAKPVTVTAQSDTKVYDGTISSSVAPTVGALATGDTVGTAPIQTFDTKNVGTEKTLTASGLVVNDGNSGNNYAITYTANSTGSITARPVTVTANHKAKNFGQTDPTLTYQITSGSLVAGDLFAGSLARDPGEDVGSYAITSTLDLGANYNLTFVGSSLTICTAAITVTADPQTKVYGQSDPELTYTSSPALQEGDSFTGSLARAEGESVGTRAITQGTLSAGVNYSISYTGANLTITPAALTVTADDKSKTVGDTDPDLTYQITSGVLVGGDSLTGSLTRDLGEDVGMYAITQGTLTSGGGEDESYNYDLTFIPGAFTINARASGNRCNLHPEGCNGGSGGGTTPAETPTPTPTESPEPTPEVLGASTVVADPANLDKNGLHKDDLITAADAGDPDVYVVNEFGYKRLLLNPAIFSFYFNWSQVHAVTVVVRDSFPTSLLVRNCETNDPKVYAMNITGEDAGTLRWVNLSSEEAVSQDADFFKKVFCINAQEFNSYTSGDVLGALSDLPTYQR